jgi:hypothetical protein
MNTSWLYRISCIMAAPHQIFFKHTVNTYTRWITLFAYPFSVNKSIYIMFLYCSLSVRSKKCQCGRKKRDTILVTVPYLCFESWIFFLSVSKAKTLPHLGFYYPVLGGSSSVEIRPGLPSLPQQDELSEQLLEVSKVNTFPVSCSHAYTVF